MKKILSVLLLLPILTYSANASKDEWSAKLCNAVGNGDIPKAQEALDHDADVNCTDTYGYTPLDEAVIAKQEKIAQLLKEKGGKKSIIHW